MADFIGFFNKEASEQDSSSNLESSFNVGTQRLDRTLDSEESVVIEQSEDIEHKYNPRLSLGAAVAGEQVPVGSVKTAKALFESKAQVSVLGTTPLSAHKTRRALLSGTTSPLRAPLAVERNKKHTVKMVSDDESSAPGTA